MNNISKSKRISGIYYSISKVNISNIAKLLFYIFVLIIVQFIVHRDFKLKSEVEKVIVLWTANTERFADVEIGLNTTMDELEKSLKENKTEISPSTIFAMASISEKVSFT